MGERSGKMSEKNSYVQVAFAQETHATELHGGIAVEDDRFHRRSLGELHEGDTFNLGGMEGRVVRPALRQPQPTAA